MHIHLNDHIDRAAISPFVVRGVANHMAYHFCTLKLDSYEVLSVLYSECSMSVSMMAMESVSVVELQSLTMSAPLNAFGDMPDSRDVLWALVLSLLAPEC